MNNVLIIQEIKMLLQVLEFELKSNSPNKAFIDLLRDGIKTRLDRIS